MSMYQGQKPFDREQLVFCVEAVMAGAMDRIEAFLPPTVPYSDYLERKNEIEHMIHGATQTVAIVLPILWAQLNGDGMGVADFYGWESFEKAVYDYVKKVTKQNVTEEVEVPRFRKIAERFVDREFKEYLPAKIKSKAGKAKTTTSLCPPYFPAEELEKLKARQ